MTIRNEPPPVPNFITQPAEKKLEVGKTNEETLETFCVHKRLIDMTKKFRNYVISIFSIFGTLWIINMVCVLFETMPYADIAQIAHIRWGILIIGIIAAAWFIWRGIDGFYRKMNFFVDDNDHRW
jgi:hypothetical protein